jgi:hypothetical protein
MIYTTSQIQKQLPDLLEKAMLEGKIQFKTKDGRIFVIRLEKFEVVPNTSPLDVKSIKLPVTTNEILQAVRESRERYS